MITLAYWRVLVHKLQNLVSDYIPGEGAYCPACKVANLPIPRNARVYRTVELVRYCQCVQCGAFFKAIEDAEKTRQQAILIEQVESVRSKVPRTRAKKTKRK